MRDRISKLLYFLPILGILAFFYYYPLIVMYQNIPKISFIVSYLFTNPLVTRFTIFTIIQAFLTTIFSLFIGIPAGFLLARTQPYRLTWFRTLFTVPFIFPPLAILMGFVISFDRDGILNQFSNGAINFNPFSFSGIVFAHVIFNISVFARITESALYSEPNEFHDFGKVMGASSRQRFRAITLPHITPAIESGILLVFLYAFNSFAVVLVLGEVRFQTLEVMIYNQSRNRLRYDRAMALALFQIIIDTILIIIYLSRRSYQTTVLEGNMIVRSKNRIKSTLILCIISIFMWFPVMAVLSSTISGLKNDPSIAQDQLFSNTYNIFLGASSLRVILNTVFFGLLTSVVVVISAVLLSLASISKNNSNYDKLFNFLILLPMTTSAITLSFAIILTYGTNPRFNEFVWVFILGSHILATLPFCSRIIFSARKRIPEDLILVSRSFGAGTFNQFKHVVWPFMRNSIVVAGLFSLAISIGEFGSTLYLVRGEWVTLSLAINKLFLTRNVLLPNLYALMLISFATILLFIIEKLGSLELKL